MPVTDLVSAYVFLALQETEMTAPNTLTLSWIFDIFFMVADHSTDTFDRHPDFLEEVPRQPDVVRAHRIPESVHVDDCPSLRP